MRAFHKTKLESDSNSAVKDHFIRGELRRKQSKSKPLVDYNWKCNHCDRSMSYSYLK